MPYYSVDMRVPLLIGLLAATSIALVSPAKARPIIEDPKGGALLAFHKSLKRTARGLDQTRILQFGASHTECDIFTGYLRRFMQSRFGDAGHGYLMPARPWKGYRHQDLRLDSSDGWVVDKALGATSREDGLYGLGGFSCASNSSDAWAFFGTSNTTSFGRSASRFEIFFLEQPTGGRFEVLVDGQPYLIVSTYAAHLDFGVYVGRFEDGPHEIELRPLGDGEVRLLGASLERGAPGVIVDTLGIRGARAADLLDIDEDLWIAQVKHRRPDLIVLAYGTNEAGDEHQPIQRYVESLSAVLTRVKRAAPDSSCVLIGPTDRPVKTPKRRKGAPPGWKPRPRVEEVNDAQRLVSGRFGCGFFSAYDAMGGPLSMVKWREASLAQKDHIHLTTRGYELLAEHFAKGLLQGYGDRAVP